MIDVDSQGLSPSAAGRKRLRQKLRYGTRHKLTRKLLEPVVLAGMAYCVRCQELIEPGSDWDLGHDDYSGRHSGPEHRRCNRGAPNRNQTSREW